MSLPTLSLDIIRARARAFFRSSFKGFPMGSKQFFGQTANALALNAWGLQKSIEDLDLDIVPRPQSSPGTLADWAFDLGLPNGAGGYGAQVPTTASGGAATLTGVQGTSYTDGITATAEDGTTQVKLSGTVTIPGSAPGTGSIAAKFVAVTAGTVGNLPIGTVLTWTSPPAGADATFILTTALSGATDTESSATLYARIVARLQTPPRGGVAEDYRIWAETVAGIKGVWVYPRRSGTGSVDVVITVGGSGTSRVPSNATKVLVQAALDANRPVAVESATALLPATTTGRILRVRVKPTTANAFDWDDTATSYTVDTYAAGPPATLKLNTLAPATLKAAIDSYKASTGLAPRLQVLSTNASAVNPQIKAVDYSDSGGKTTLTLESLFATWHTPTAGDTVYAGGPAVDIVAAGELALIDSLGPSEASGFQDSISPWQDTLTISNMIAVAQNAIDANGSSLIVEVLAGGATIGAVAADVEGVDQTTPELLFAKHIAVTA